MKRFLHGLGALALSSAVLLPAALTAAALLGIATPAAAQGLFYKEVEKDGRIYVFNTARKYADFQKSGDMGVAITMLGQGPNGETVVAENETALDLYNFKHDRPGYVREAPKVAAAPALPTAIRIGSEGELKFGLLLQGWYIADDSPLSIPTGTTTNSTLGNYIGSNSFRLRRSEMKLNGKINGSWSFEVMIDPAKAITPQTANTDAKILQDLAVTFTGLKGWELSLGQKKIALTEEGVRSSSELDFPERAQIVRAVSDRRETGFFFKGDVVEQLTLWGSVSNGVASNVLDDSNDTLNACGRADIKVVHGLVFGGSGCYSGGETVAHLGRTRMGGHARFNGGHEFPLIAEAEYISAKDARAGALDLKRDGFYGSALYTVADMIQVGVRYDVITNDKDAQDGENGVTQKNSRIKTWTFGVHWLPLGHDKYKNVSVKLDYFKVKQDNRLVNGVLEDSYGEFLVAAQVAF
ncbi:MAG TPA: porin [Thermoanaerobaculia bacterium]|nr:porin [Thermoanaerobaculia bacterium]